MQFLRTLFWVVIAALLAIVASHNWRDVTVNLWANLLVDIKLPLLLAIFFLLGFLPTFVVMRARLWQVKRRLISAERALAPAPAAPAESDDEAGEVANG